MKELLDLYLSFFKMGAVTFGGGYTMLPILKRECVENKRWVSDEQVMDFYAVSQGLPGIIAVNVAVFIGYHVRRTAGGIAAALGCVSPCIIIISIIAAFLTNFRMRNRISTKYAMRHHGMAENEGIASPMWTTAMRKTSKPAAAMSPVTAGRRP